MVVIIKDAKDFKKITRFVESLSGKVNCIFTIKNMQKYAKHLTKFEMDANKIELSLNKKNGLISILSREYVEHKNMSAEKAESDIENRIVIAYDDNPKNGIIKSDGVFMDIYKGAATTSFHVCKNVNICMVIEHKKLVNSILLHIMDANTDIDVRNAKITMAIQTVGGILETSEVQKKFLKLLDKIDGKSDVASQ